MSTENDSIHNKYERDDRSFEEMLSQKQGAQVKAARFTSPSRLVTMGVLALVPDSPWDLVMYGAAKPVLFAAGKAFGAMQKLQPINRLEKYAATRLSGKIILLQAELKLNPEQLIRVHPISGKGSVAAVKQIEKSMRLNGFDIKQPIEVVIHNNKFYIIDGHHRYRAALMAGINKIPVKVVSDIKNHPSSWNTIEEVVKDASLCGPDHLKFKY